MANRQTLREILARPISQPARWRWFVGISVIVVAIDQWSKVYAVTNWKGMPPKSYLCDIFRIQYAENDGAFLGMFSGMSEEVRFWLLTVLTGLMMLAMTIYMLMTSNIRTYVFLAFTMIVAGGIGNLIDRVRFRSVIDYFNLGLNLGDWIGFFNIRTGIFNVADMAITGAFLMMIPVILWRDFPDVTVTESSPQPTSPTTEATSS